MDETTGQPEADRRSQPSGDRRAGEDRRRSVVDRRSGLDRRRGAGRRRTDERRSAEEGEMTEEQFVFIQALNQYKKLNNTPFPTWTEVLDVVKYLGYRKVAEVGEFSLTPDGRGPES
ncbi:MAG: hypothetical protein BIFFINMI_03420 [Phycisphaerae bacterium]|nr:hypothetical protein [Phycisphaerae bacterium]